jgi:predicted protein tyrosine phosphatase
MSAHRLIRYPFRGTSIIPFDAYGRSVLRHRRPLNFSACGYSAPPACLALPDEIITMRKYLLSVLAIIAATIIAAETAELALDANGNTSKIFIPKDDFTIEERSTRQRNDARAAKKRRLLSIQIDEFFEYLESTKLAVAQTAAPIRPKKVTKLSTLT